jgi:hypothetical protein
MCANSSPIGPGVHGSSREGLVSQQGRQSIERERLKREANGCAFQG